MHDIVFNIQFSVVILSPSQHPVVENSAQRHAIYQAPIPSSVSLFGRWVTVAVTVTNTPAGLSSSTLYKFFVDGVKVNERPRSNRRADFGTLVRKFPEVSCRGACLECMRRRFTTEYHDSSECMLRCSSVCYVCS